MSARPCGPFVGCSRLSERGRLVINARRRSLSAAIDAADRERKSCSSSCAIQTLEQI